MSRAFTKEIDDQPPSPAPEEPISFARNLVTPQGARMIEAAVASLEERLRRSVSAEERPALKRELNYWHARHASMEIVAYVENPTAVRFGTVATVIRAGGKRQDLTIVGEDEADPKAGKIAWTSPLATAIEGAGPGEEIEFELPARSEAITIEAIRSAAE
ncbi:hypothetical protein CO661_27775 [Sinorhizobium fredii]|uniref:Transcription elongation factor GreA/GreB C-terminal domain-containing protein n=1 Tax=Rhizobium fredii TaxID=380 RepID=A0A2A6LQ72_RHIFR|nr:GreA/GreB family elongation factor [Sinorhizobium fredii]PDT44711.1 hypothetical protein CO661_27775 [Sinorhizobium fredii]